MYSLAFTVTFTKKNCQFNWFHQYEMARGKALSTDLRESIIAAHKNGKSAYEIGRNLSIALSTVQGVINNFKQRGSIEIGKSSGRPKKTNLHNRRALRKIINENRFKTLTKE